MDTQTLAEVGQKKPYISMATIAKYRSKFVSTQKGKAACNVKTVFAFEREDGIVFICSHGYRRSASEVPDYSDVFHYKLAIRKNKKGEKRFIFYRVNRQGNATSVRTSNPNQMRVRMESAALPSYRNNKKVEGIPKAQLKRLLRVVCAFLVKHGVSYRGLSNDPFSMMYQLCYPGSTTFDSETLQQLQCSKFLLGNPVKNTLRTNGKLSKKLIYETIKSKPRAINTALTLARYLRINRSLDHAQQFLKLFSEEKRYFWDDSSPRDNFAVPKLKAKQMRVFDKLGVEELIEVARDHITLCDTFMMIGQLGGVEGFNFNEVEYKSLKELHDHLVELAPNRRYFLGEKEFTHYDFDKEGASMVFCSCLKDKLKDKYDVSYAENTRQLEEQGEKLHNCSFTSPFYHPRIALGNYAIFCIDGKYMFGVNLNNKSVKLEQAVTFCNVEIEQGIYTKLNREVRDALAGSYNYSFRESNGLW